MKYLRNAIGIIAILAFIAVNPVIAAENHSTAFLMEKTQFKPVSGDCMQGQGVLEITGFEGNRDVVGKYTGECKDNRPNGVGELVSPDPVYNWDRIVKGTWKNGAYHGTITFTYPKAREIQVSKEIYTYKDDIRDGPAEIYDGKGRLMLTLEYRDDQIISSCYVDPDGKKKPIKYDPGYITRLKSDFEKVLIEYQRALTFDEYYLKTLNDDQAVQELFLLQNALDESLSNFIFVKEKGVKVYEPETTGRLNLFSLMHSARLNRFRLDLGREFTHNYEYGFTALYLGFTDVLYYAPPEKRPSTSMVVETIKKIAVPGSLMDGLTVYLAPFSIKDTNGYYEFDYKTIALFGSGRFPYAAGPSTIAHELGHAVHDRLMERKDWEEYWSLRSVPPRKSNLYAQVNEVFAEDFRVLFGYSEKASYMREGQWRGQFGDIREFPDKKKQVLDFLNRKIRDYTPRNSAIDRSKLVYHRIFKPSESIRIGINQEGSCQAKITRFQRIPLGNPEKYQKKIDTVSLAAFVRKGRSFWSFGTKTRKWDKLEILEDGKVIHTLLPNEEILVTIDDVTKKYEGRFITYLKPDIDGPLENFVEQVEVSSKTLGQGEAVFSLQGYSTGFYQLEVALGENDQNVWKYFFVVFEDGTE